MASLNKVTLIGNLGRDPEARSFANGGKVVKFSVATSESWTKDGQRQERTEWHNVVIYDEKIADVAERYLRKGSKVYLEGALQSREYDDSSGQKQRVTEVVLQRFRGSLIMLDSREQGGKREADPLASDNPGNQPWSNTQQAGFDPDLDDDVPF